MLFRGRFQRLLDFGLLDPSFWTWNCHHSWKSSIYFVGEPSLVGTSQWIRQQPNHVYWTLIWLNIISLCFQSTKWFMREAITCWWLRGPVTSQYPANFQVIPFSYYLLSLNFQCKGHTSKNMNTYIMFSSYLILRLGSLKFFNVKLRKSYGLKINT